MNESMPSPQKSEETLLSFDSKFELVNKIEVLGEPVEYLDLVPETQKSEVPVFIAPGWAETPLTFKDTTEAFYDAGRRVLTVKHGRLVPDSSLEVLAPDERVLMSEYNIEDQGSIPIPELLKARNILAVLNDRQLTQVDIVAHSEGAINALIAAALSPERFRNIILCGPAGITEKGEDNAFKRVFGGIRTYALDVTKIIFKPEERKGIIRASNESAKYNLSNPSASLDEIGALSSFNVESIIKKLNEKGIKVSIIQGQNDSMFSSDDMKKMIEKDEIYEFHDLPEGDHHTLYTKEEATYIEQVLSGMENNTRLEENQQ